MELESNTGHHLTTYPLKPGYHYACRNTEGVLIYQREDTLLFFDPPNGISREVVIDDLDDFYMGATKSRLMTFWSPLKTNKIALHGSKGRFIGIDLSLNTADKKRILWDQIIENLHTSPHIDDPLVLPMLLKDGEILYLDQATGEIVFREVFPFETFWDPMVHNGIMYVSVEGRLIGWRLAYYR